MSGILTRPVAPGDLYNTLAAFATGHLEGQGDTGVRIISIDHIVSESSDKVDVYHAAFASDDGTNIVELTLFSNGTREACEL